MGYGQLNYRIGRSGSVIELNDGARIQRYYPARVELGRGVNGAVRKFVNSDDPNAVSFAVKSLITNYEGDDDRRLLDREAQFLSEAYPGYNIKFVTFNGADVKSKLNARLVMPALPGSNSHDALSRFPARSLEIILAAAKELQGVHDLGIIHGDIKFDNFIINLKADNTFEARLIDFGWSYHSHDSGARATPEDCPHWAPERKKVTKRSPIVPPDASQDIYSFGFMLAYARNK